MIVFSDKDEEMRLVLCTQLREAGFDCRPAGSARELRGLLAEKSVQVWVTDGVFPESRLEDIIREVHSLSPVTQILVLSNSPESELARTELTCLIEAGATDFLAKPFDRNSLVAKVRALLRRRGNLGTTGAKVLALGDLTLNPGSYDVHCGAVRTPLTPSEFKLLQGLMLEQGAVLSRDQLIAIVQGAGIVVVDRAVDTHVASLRKKLGSCGSFIETVRGVGYRIRA